MHVQCKSGAVQLFPRSCGVVNTCLHFEVHLINCSSEAVQFESLVGLYRSIFDISTLVSRSQITCIDQIHTFLPDCQWLGRGERSPFEYCALSELRPGNLSGRGDLCWTQVNKHLFFFLLWSCMCHLPHERNHSLQSKSEEIQFTFTSDIFSFSIHTLRLFVLLFVTVRSPTPCAPRASPAHVLGTVRKHSATRLYFMASGPQV